MSQTSDFVRKTFLENDTKRDEGLTTPKTIQRFDDILYGTYPQWQSLDVYSPIDSSYQTLPVIVNIHGGGWVYGYKETYQYYCMNLAERGFKVVNFSYRLAPEFKFPAALEDTNTVFNWIEEESTKYGFDTGNVFAVGDSAGANLLGIYAGVVAKPSLGRRFDIVPPESLNLKAIALNHGAYRIEELNSEDDGGLNASLMEDLFPKGGQPYEVEKIDVTKYVHPDYPPTFIATSKQDFLKNQAVLMAEALTKNDVPFIYRFLADRQRELPHVFHINIRDEVAKVLNDEECDFFKSFL